MLFRSHGVAGLFGRAHQVEDVAHRHAAPLGDTGPALDAEVLRDLLVVWQRPQLLEAELYRILDEAVDAEAIAREMAVEQRAVPRALWVLAVVPEIRRDVVLGGSGAFGSSRDSLTRNVGAVVGKCAASQGCAFVGHLL